MDNEKKTGAETAREERKARIEKASQNQAQKKEKKANQSATAKRAKIIVPIVVAVIAIACALLYYFGVPQRVLTAATLSDGTKISVVEFEYYYKTIYNNYVNTAYQYDTYYGEGVGAMYTGGFDYSKTPESQEYTAGDLDKKYGKKPTWADFFEESTLKQIAQLKAVYNEAIKAGYKLEKEDQASVDKQVEDLRKTAAESNYSLNAYLLNNYSRGMNESMLRNILEEYAVIDKYDADKQEELKNSITDKQIQAAYDKNPTAYQQVSLKAFYLAGNADNKDKTIDTMNKFYEEANLDNFVSLAYTYAPEEEKENYKDSEQATDAAGLNGDGVKQYFGEEAQKWAFDANTKVGDKYLVKNEKDDGTVDCYTLVMKETAKRDDTLQPINVRHILFALSEDKTDDDGNKTTVTIRTMDEARKEAQALLDQWVKDGAKEDAFIKLANEKSDDPGSSDNGGLYEGVTTTSSYVKPFLDWCFAQGRKVGDYGLVETEYGVHVMYMSSISDTTQWQSQIKESLYNEAYNKFFESLIDEDKDTSSVSDFLVGRIRKRVDKFAAQTVSALNAQKEAAQANQAANTAGASNTADTTKAAEK